MPYSFVTTESVLQFHQWIPERISQVTSITAFGRNNQFTNIFGQFVYSVPSISSSENFYTGVQVLQIGKQSVWMATARN